MESVATRDAHCSVFSGVVLQTDGASVFCFGTVFLYLPRLASNKMILLGFLEEVKFTVTDLNGRFVYVDWDVLFFGVFAMGFAIVVCCTIGCCCCVVGDL